MFAPLRAEDFPGTSEDLISALNDRLLALGDAVGGALTLTDNFYADVVNIKASHAAPVNVRTRVKNPKSAMLLSCDGQIVFGAPIVSPRADGTSDVTLWFTDATAKEVPVSLLMLPDGQQSGTRPTLAIPGASIAAPSITTEHLFSGAVTAGKINVSQLSAVSADMGTLTAGRIILLSTTHLYAIGIGFGTSSQFLAWYGPRPSGDNLSLCTEANGLYYLKTNGTEYLNSASVAQSTADSKNKTFYQTSAPTASATGDIWFDTDDNYKTYRWDGGAWVSVRDVAPHTFYQTSAPTAISVGDIWFDTDDGFLPYRWSGSAWVSVQDGDIAIAQTTADSKIKSFYQTSAPTASTVGDIWYDTDDGFKMYRWDGGTWVSVRDTTIATAQTTADSKNKTFYQTSAPTATAVGDLWFDTDDNFKPYRWNGSTWDPVHDSTPIVAGDISATLGGGNMLLNSSFEDTTGALNNWTGSGTGTFTTAAGDTGQFRYGTKAAKFVQTVTGVDSYYYQRYAVPKPSTKYILTGWVYVSSISGGAVGSRALLIYDGVTSATDVTLTTGHTLNTWTRHSTAFTSSASPSYIECRMYAPNGTVYWDGLQLEEGDVATSYAPRPSELTPESVGTTELAVGSVTTGKMTANTINGDRITTNTLDAGKIVAGSITTDRFTSNTIDGNIVTAGTLDAGKIVAGSISTTQMTANTINGDRITGNTLNANKIIGGTITANELGTDSVIAGKIQAGAIVADKISANEVVSAKFSTGRSNFHNLWPNPSSEIAPPGTYTPPGDGTDPEFDFRFDASGVGGTYSGNFVRQMKRTTAGTTTLVLKFPALEFEAYWTRFKYKWISTGGTPTGSVSIEYLDRANAVVGGLTGFTLPTANTSWTTWYSPNDSGWTYVPTQAIWTRVTIKLVTAASGTAEYWLDQLTAFRAVQTEDIDAGAITVAKLAGVPTWTSFGAGLTNSWTSFGAPHYSPSYTKDMFGFIHIRGSAASGSGSIFTMPSGYRPFNAVAYPLLTVDAIGVVYMDELFISSAGVITPNVNGTGSNHRIMLDGMYFDTRG